MNISDNLLNKLTDSEFVVCDGYEDEADPSTYMVSIYRKRDGFHISEEDYGEYLGQKVRDVIVELCEEGFWEVEYAELQNR